MTDNDETPVEDLIDFEPENEEEDEYVVYDISVYPSDFTLDTLISLRKEKEIVIPDYQRKYVWNIKQASLLVDSFLIGLPVPPIFLYQTDDRFFEVIDGHQRVQSLEYFFEGFFGPADKDGKRQEFRLTGLSEKSPYAGKRFIDLDPPTQRLLKFSVLRAINIKQNQPNSDGSSAYYIFERLNTGGTALRPQEVRNVVVRGAIVKSLGELNRNTAWRKILGKEKADKYQTDVELVLRLLALFSAWENYEKPMKAFLNKEMRKEKDFVSERAALFSTRFPDVCLKVIDALGERPFRPKRVINAAFLEAVLVALLEHPDISIEQIRSGYSALEKDENFLSNIRGATTDTMTVRNRIKRAVQLLTLEVSRSA